MNLPYQLMMSDEDKVMRGQRAGMLIQSEAYQEVITEIREMLHLALDNQPTDDNDIVMPIVRQLRAVKAIETKLLAWEQDGARIGRLNA